MREPGASWTIVAEAGPEPGTRVRAGAVPRAIGFGPRGRTGQDRLSPGRRGGIRTSLLTLVTLVALAAVVVIVLAGSLTPPENAPAPRTGSPPDASPRASASAGPEIAGTISIARDLAGRIPDTSVLFVIAHKAAGPPFAVRRIVSPRFPLAYRLGPEDLMMAGAAFEGEVRVSARLSRTGSAGPAQPGDLEGEHAAPVRVGARNADIAISRVR